MRRRWLTSLLDSVPSVCAICQRWPQQGVCASCRAEFAPTVPRCRGCATALPPMSAQVTSAHRRLCGPCIQAPPPWRCAHAAVEYQYPWAGLINRFKYGDSPGWARHLAGLLPDPAGPELAMQPLDWIVPIPSTPDRWRERGYNPALELARHWTARGAAAGVPLRLVPDALTRPYRARPQASLARAQRLRNTANAFVVPDKLRSGLSAARVVLLDDVMTTGSTLREATLALNKAGCSEVAVCVVARVPPPLGDEAVAIDHPGTDSAS